MDAAVLLGRFQPFDSVHAGLLQTALATAPKVVMILGSSFSSRNAKSPFTWQERAAMIGSTLSEAERERVHFVPIRDYYDDGLRADAVRAAVAALGYAPSKTALIGDFKDASSYYLNHYPGSRLQSCAKWKTSSTRTTFISSILSCM